MVLSELTLETTISSTPSPTDLSVAPSVPGSTTSLFALTTNVLPSNLTSSKYPFDVASTVVKSLSVVTVDTVLSSSFLTLSNSLFKLLICSVCVFTVAPIDFGTCAFIIPSISVKNEMLVLLANVRSLPCCECGSGMNWGLLDI